MDAEALERPLAIDRLYDGHAYVRPAAPLVQTNLYLQIARVDDLFLKVPSTQGLQEYRALAKEGRARPENVRAVEDIERFDRLDSTLEIVSALKPLSSIGKELTHYLAVHKLQYERLKSQTAVGIPEARFGVLRSARFHIFYQFEAALFQERVSGTTLWDMFDFSTLQVAPQWRPFLPGISAQLSALIDSPLMLDHIDWNIKNFVFQEAAERVFYVDLKPTFFLTRESSDHNLKGIRDYFIV